jgi:transposase-like protein
LTKQITKHYLEDMKLVSLQDAMVYFSDPARCREYLIANRWPNGVECPRCGSKDVLFLEKYNRWHCRAKHEAPQFTLKTGTVMEDSAVGLDKWLPAFWLLSNCKNGISSYELSRAIGVTQKSAWFMLQRIRLAMQEVTSTKMGGPESGPIEVDETYIGGKPKNMHKEQRKAKAAVAPIGGTSGKAIVMGMRDRETRRVRAKVIPNVKRVTLQAEILENIEKKSTVYTDAAFGYYELAHKDFVHDTVNHVNEYVRGQVHTQGIENFWSLLKRGLNGTYVAVEPFHLDRYVTEQVFRFNNRATKDNPLTDADRFTLAVSQISGKRLTYAELTGKVGETTEEPF